MTVHELLDAALTVKPIAASLSEDAKNKGLHSMAESLIAHTQYRNLPPLHFFSADLSPLQTVCGTPWKP